MAALTLVSCSSDDLDSLSDNSSKNKAISFDGYLGRSAVAVNGTRGSVEFEGDRLRIKVLVCLVSMMLVKVRLLMVCFVCNQKVTYSTTSIKVNILLLLSIGHHKVILISWRMLLM